MHSETNKAYMAGLMDGEGHIGITLSAPRSRGGEMRTHSVIVTVSNTYLPLMDDLRADWGGTLVVRRVSKTSNTMIGNLRWSSKAAADVLNEIRPYLIIKHEQADHAIAFSKELANRPSATKMITEDEWNRREELRVAIRQLNRPDPTVVVLPYPVVKPRICVICREEYTTYKSSKSMYCSQKCIAKGRWQQVKAEAS